MPGQSVCAAHPISVTETRIFITRTLARVRIQLFAEDLYLFQDLEPDAADVISADDLKKGLEEHRQFLLDKVTLRDAAGELIKGQVTDVQPFDVPDEGISVDDLMLHSATYELEFPFQEPPEFLTLQQDISDENFIFPSEMKLTLHQAGTDLTYTDNLKPGAAISLRFDWEQLPLAEDATEEDWQAWFEKQREATLGITSYSSVYSFVYIEPAEVRHEVLIPLASLKTILPLKHADPAFIEVPEQDAVRELIEGWLKDVNPTSVNGKTVLPEFTRIDFYGLDLKDFAQQAGARRVSLASGRVGIIMTYRTLDDSVRDVSLTWNKFHSSLRKIQSVVFAYPDELQRFEFSRFNEDADNIFHWTVNEAAIPEPAEAVPAEIPSAPELQIPVASTVFGLAAMVAVLFRPTRRWTVFAGLLVAAVGCWPFARAGVANPFQTPVEITAVEAEDIFQKLHGGTYRALDFGTEARIYEVLERTADGSLLEEIYLQLRQSLQMREQGGAVARVREVQYVDGEMLNRSNSRVAWPGFQYRSTWTVSGTVEHWGHVHERQNQFDATFTVEPRNSHWKITGMDIAEQNSIATKTRLRRF